MRNWKRLLSVFLASLLAFSVTTVAFAAGSSPEEIEKQLIEQYDKGTLLDDQKQPIQLALNYQALTDKQKDAMSVDTQYKVIDLGYKDGQKLYTAETGNTSSKMKEEDYLKYSAKVIGELTENQMLARNLFVWAYGKAPYQDVTLTSSLKFVASGSVTEETAQKNRDALASLNETYKNAPDAVKELAQNFWFSTYIKPAVNYYYALSGLLTLNYNLKTQLNPYKSLTDEEKEKYGNVENRYYDAIYRETLRSGILSANQKKGFEGVMQVADAYDYFWNNEYDESKLVKALADYDALSSDEKLAAEKCTRSMSACYSTVSNHNKGTVTITSYKNVVGYARKAANMGTVRDYIAYINGVKEPYTNEDVKQARVENGKVESFLKDLIPKEVTDKYNAIQNSYVPVPPLTPSDEKPDVSKWQPGTPDYDFGVNATRAADALDGVNELFPVIMEMLGVGSLQAMLEEGVYTNATVTQLMVMIYNDVLYPLINDAGYGFIAGSLISPSAIAKTLDEEKFSGIKAKLTAAGSSMDGWTKIAEMESGDWGFQDGDQDGFFQGIAGGLRKLMDLVTNGYKILGMGIDPILKLANTTNSDGDYVYGAYEDLIPILEGLGLEGLMTSEEYTEAFNAGSGNAKYDNLLLPILRPVGKLIDKLAADPVNTLIQVLPRAAALIDSGALNSGLAKVLARITAFEIPEVDLTADGLNTMLEGLVNGIILGADEATGAEGVALKFIPIDWKKLSTMGTLEVVSSVTASNHYRALVKANGGDVLALVLDYVTSLVAGNVEAIEALLNSMPEVAPLAPALRPYYSDQARLSNLLYDIVAPARDVVLEDKESGIRVLSNTSVIPEDAVLTVNAIESGSLYDSIAANLKDTADKFKTYEIALTRNGEAVRIDGRVSIVIPMDYAASRTMVYQANEAELKALSWKEADGAASFYSHSTGCFVMAQAKEEVVVPPVVDPEKPTDPVDPSDPSEPGVEPGDGSGTTEIPQTGDKGLSAFALLSVAAGAAFLFAQERKKRS